MFAPRRSLRHKLTALMVATGVGTTVLSSGAMFVYEMRHISQTASSELAGLAAVIAQNSTAPLAFADPRAGAETLAALRADTRVLAARIYDRSGGLFASYRPQESVEQLPDRADDLALFAADVGQTLFVPVELAGERIGTVALIGSSTASRQELVRYSLVVVGAVGMAWGFAFLAARRLQRLVSEPVMQLAETAARISVDRDYALRAARETDDELGLLVDRFNDMLAQIQLRDEALRQAQADLEDRVKARTAELEQEIRVRRYAEEALMEAKEAAEAASLAKSSFLANMSHELRTPLNAIIGYSEMLQEVAEERDLHDFLPDLKRVRSAGKHLLSLINDILDLSKIDAGRMELSTEVFDPESVLNDVLATAVPLAERRGNTLSLAPHGPLGTMTSDITRIRQVLLNLVGNACKFTESGRVTIGVQRRPGAGGEEMVFTVSDTGIGIGPDTLRRLFREFTQADASTTRKYGGTGLGLAICHRLCSMLGGEIAVESTIGVGSTFTVTLPVLAPQPQREDKRAQRWSGPGVHSATGLPTDARLDRAS